LKLVSIPEAIAALKIGKVTVRTDAILYDGRIVHSHLTERMLDLLTQGLDVAPWARFMERLYANPSKIAVDELYLWLERSRMPITEDGCFLAYKKVKDDYTSYRSHPDGSPCRNDLGTWVSMPRNAVDDRRHNTCSTGLHFCSWGYLPHYHGAQGRVLIVKIDPAHVVSIPSDYANAKGRAEAYFIYDEIAEADAPHAFENRCVVETNSAGQEVLTTTLH
jgi:hypothetical protein